MLGARLQPRPCARSAPASTYATIQARARRRAHGSNAGRPRRRLPGHARPRQPAQQPARRLLREPDHGLAGQAPGRRPGRLPGQHATCPASIIDAGAFGGDTQLATDWYTTIGAPDLGRQPGRQRRRRASTSSPRRTRPRRAGRARQFTSAFTGRHRRVRHPRRRPAGLPGQHQRPHRAAHRPAAEHQHPGRRDLRQRLRRATCRSPTTWSRTTAAATARSGSARRTCRPRTPTSTTRTCGSPTTGSSPTPAPTSPVAIGLFAGSDGYEVADNDICGNFSLEYGGGVSVYGLSPNGEDPPQPDLPQQVQRRGRRHHDRRRSSRPTPTTCRPAPARWTSTPTRSRPTSPTTTAAASGS